MIFSPNMQIIEFDSFDTAFPVAPGQESATRRQFMTLFASDEVAQAGGTSYVCKVQSVTGQVFALKRLLTGSATPQDAHLSEEDTARITQGQAAAFYEEYKNQLLVSNMRGFPKLFGYGMIGEDPAILMEWVEGVSLRAIAREAARSGVPFDARAIAAIGASVLDVLESAGRLDSTLVHRDISPANIMVRTNALSFEEQAKQGRFEICLIDFGSASAASSQDASFTMASQLWRNGTPEYAAPEMLTQDIARIDKLRKSQAIDVFALCSVLYELYAGHTPWRVGEHPEVSPFRLKMETPPEPIELREALDAPLVDAIMAGLAVEQQERPGVMALRRELIAFADVGDDSRALDAPRHTSTPRAVRVLEAALPVGAYTPESTRLKVVPTAEGGGRAGEAVPVFERTQARGISRRAFVAGGLAMVAAAIVGGGVAARSCGREGAYDFSNYSVAQAIWSGEVLYPAMHIEDTSWVLRDVGAGVEFSLGTDGREPGRLIDGLMRAYDPASGNYGFKTVAEDAGAPGGRKTAWAVLPTFANVGDFGRRSSGDAHEVGGVASTGERFAAVQDRASGLWGYIDATGAERIAPTFAAGARLEYGYAPVREQGADLWGLIDAEGNRVLPPRFSDLGMCSAEGLMAAREQGGAYWGFVDAGGVWAIPARYEAVGRFSEGLAAFATGTENTRVDVAGGDGASMLYGYLAQDGSVAIEPRFTGAFPFVDGLAPVQDAESGLWGLIDTAGKWQVEPLFLSLGEKTGDLIPAHGSPAGVYDIHGADEQAFSAFMAQNDNWEFGHGYIDEAGAWAIKPAYGDVLIRPPEL